MINHKMLAAVLLLPPVVNSAATFSTSVPFQLAGKLIIMRCTVDGQTGNFILDTGVPNLMLNARYFQGEPADREFRGLNGHVGHLTVCMPDLQIGEYTWEKTYAEVVPMQGVENSKGIPIHGLLGTKLFRNYILWIDYQSLEIRLFPLDKTGTNPDFLQLTQPFEVLPFKWKSSTPLITVHMYSTELSLTMDTGAEINLIWNKYKDELSVQSMVEEERRFGGLGTLSQQVTVRSLSSSLVNNLTSGPMKTAFVDLTDYNRFVQGPVAHGIFGYEFLSQFLVAFNFKKRELYLWKKEDVLLVVGTKREPFIIDLQQ
jgi:hypothetical protein